MRTKTRTATTRVAATAALAAAVALSGGARDAHAQNGSPPQGAIPRQYARIGIAQATPGAEAARARDQLVQQLIAEGREVTVLPVAPAEPVAPAVVNICATRGLDAVAIVRIPTGAASPPSGLAPSQSVAPRVELELHDRTGIVVLAGALLPAPAPVPEAREPPRRPKGGDFYLSVGRPDLATAYRQRWGAKIGGIVAGGAMTAFGVLWGIGDYLGHVAYDIDHFSSCELQRPTTPECDQTAGVAPWAMAAIGGIVLASSLVVTADPVPAAERARLAREYDRHALQLGAAPMPRGEGGMLMLSGRF
jgi:hypothetical protein